jgi:hypothetical protein
MPDLPPIPSFSQHSAVARVDLEKSDQRKHSGFGIASFVITLSSGLLTLLNFLIAGVFENSTKGGIEANSIASTIVGFFLLVFFGTTILGLGFGIAGLFQKKRNITFAILGIVFSLGIIFITFLVFMIGIFVK